VCCGCNGSVQADAYEVDKELLCETWHAECYAAELDDGIQWHEDEEGCTCARIEDGN
jgi:hypothetical protein